MDMEEENIDALNDIIEEENVDAVSNGVELENTQLVDSSGVFTTDGE